MISLTIKEAVEQTIDTTDHYLYLYRDGDVIFYVGRSISPLDRNLEHMGLSHRSLADQLGHVIRDNRPDSWNWTLELYTLEECISLIQQRMPEVYRHYMEVLNTPTNPRSSYKYKELADDAETVMIEHYRPCLNGMKKQYRNPLPRKYIKIEIANEGVILDH